MSKKKIQRCCFHSVDMDIHYQTEGEGPVFVCLHGGKGNSGDYFHPYLSPLAREMTMVYLDERGSGRSKPVPDSSRVSYEGMATDIDNLISHLGVQKMGILGHSFGAALALYFTLHYPHRVRELYLVGGGVADQAFTRSGWWGTVYDQETRRFDVADQVKKVGDRYNAGQIHADEAFRETVKVQAAAIIYHWPAKRDEVYEVLARTDFTFLDDSNSRFSDERAIHADMLTRLGEVDCPTLLLPGQHDISSPLEFIGTMARGIRNCEVAVMPRARHFPFIDEPEIFIAAIRKFRLQSVIR